MAASYTSFGHGDGIGTGHSGTPISLACASTSSVRTACIATRPADSLIVVRTAAISYSGIVVRRTWTSHALSLPLPQETRSLNLVIWSLANRYIGALGHWVIRELAHRCI